MFLPTITRWSRWKDRKKKIDWPLFPGYCFARFDPDDPLAILKCTGVVNIVSVEGKPAPIPEVEIESIRTLVGSELQFDPCPLIHEGQMVEVIHGPLKGVIGRLLRKDTHHARLVLSVDLIGQACRSVEMFDVVTDVDRASRASFVTIVPRCPSGLRFWTRVLPRAGRPSSSSPKTTSTVFRPSDYTLDASG